MQTPVTIAVHGTDDTSPQFYNFTGSPIPKGNWANCPVFMDDRVADLMLKIAKHIIEEPAYVWYEVNPIDRDGYVNSIVIGIMRGSSRIRHDHLLAGLQCVCPALEGLGKNAADSIYDFNGAFAAARDCTAELPLIASMLFKYVEDVAFDAVFPVDPYKYSRTPKDYLSAAAPRMLRSNLERILLDMNMAQPLTVHVLHKTAASAFLPAEAMQLYFPDAAPALTPGTGIDAYTYSRLCTSADTAPLDDSYFQKQYVSVHPYGQPRQFRLRRLFQEFRLGPECPVIKYRKAGEVWYRVDRATLQDTSPALVRYWSKEAPHKLESVVFKIPYEDFFVTLILFPLFVYHVKMTFRAHVCKSASYIQDHIVDKVNGVLTRIRDWAVFAAHEVTIPNMALQAPLHTHLVANLRFDHRLPALKVIEARLVTMNGMFVRSFQAGPNALFLRYVRCSDYSPLGEIRQQLSQMSSSGSSKRATLESVAKTYNLTRDVVSTVLESVAEGGDGQRVHPSHQDGIVLEIRRVNDYEISIRARGVHVGDRILKHAISLVHVQIREGGLLASPIAVSAPTAQSNTLRIRQALAEEGNMLDGGDLDEFDASETDADTDIEDENETESSSPKDDAIIDDLDTGGYTLARLKHADPGLFAYKAKSNNYKTYAANCAANAHRQPIVVTPKQADANAVAYPGAFKNRVNAGSTPEKRERNVYICPDVWCPRSEVAMTKAQYDAAGGCPGGKDEKPLIMGSGEQKYVSFLDPSKHPSEFCAPCCFSANHMKADGRLAARLQRCGGGGAEEASNGQPEMESYVKGDVFPLEDGRFGRLPASVARYFRTPVDLTKLTPNKLAFVRRGIQHNNQYFMSCMAAVLHPPGASGWSELATLISSHLQPHDFIALNGGGLVRMFADDADELSSPQGMQRLEAWLARHDSYVQAYGLQELAKRISAEKSPGSLSDQDMAYASREFTIMCAMNRFLDYLHSPAPKDHTVLLELFMSRLPWLNPKHINVLIIETSPDGRVFLLCPKYADYARLIDVDRPFALVMKYRQFYEPIVCATSDVIEETFRMDANTYVRRLVDKARAFCMRTLSSESDKIMAALVEFLGKRDGSIKRPTQAVGAGLRPQALISADGIYVPLPPGARLLHGLPCAHLPQALRLVTTNMPLPKITRFFTGLRTKVSPFYEHRMAADGEMTVGPDHATVVTSSALASHVMREYIIDLGVFTSGSTLPTSHAWEVKRLAARGAVSRAFASIMLAGLNARTEFEFLRAKENPFTFTLRRAKMMALLKTVGVSSFDESTVDALMTWDPTIITGWYSDDITQDILTQAEVDAGALGEGGTPIVRLLDDMLGEEEAGRGGSQALLADGALRDIHPAALGRLLPGFGVATVAEKAAFLAELSHQSGMAISTADARALLTDDQGGVGIVEVMRDVLHVDVYLFKDGGTWPQRVGDHSAAKCVMLFEDADGMHVMTRLDGSHKQVFGVKDFDVKGTRGFYNLLTDVIKQQQHSVHT